MENIYTKFNFFKIGILLRMSLIFFMPTVLLAQTSDWEAIAPSNTPKWVGNSVMINNKMYVFSGFDTPQVHTTPKCEVYDPVTNTWLYLADMPYPVTHAGVTVDGDKVYISGGFLEGGSGGSNDPSSNYLQIYNTNTNTWSTGPSLPAKSASHALVRIGRKLHSLGGLLPDRQTDTGAHYVLDLNNLAAGWTVAAPLPLPRNHIASANVAGKIYVLGGQQGHDGTTQEVNYAHVYDPSTDSWSRLNNLPYVRSHSETATFVIDGQITLVGGVIGANNFLNTVTTYNPATDTWTEQPPLPIKLFGPSAEVINNELIVSNGSIDTRTNPQTTARKRTIVRTPNYKMGFSPSNISLSASMGTTSNKEAILWTSSGSPTFNIDTNNLPNWLTVSPTSGSIDLLGGTEIKITADAANLAVGSYTATVTTKATGYPDATLQVSFTVTGAKPKLLYLYGSMPPAIHDMKLTDTGSKGMSQFNAALEETGFTPVQALDANVTLNAETLNNYKVLILGSNNRRFTNNEKIAVATWVNAGGGLVAWSDAAFGWEDGGLNSTAGATSDNDLMQQFGMEFLRDNGLTSFKLDQWASNHYINKFNKNAGITIEAEGASPIRTSSPATIIAYMPEGKAKLNSLDGQVTPADAAMAIAKIGHGRVLGYFDRNAFWNAGDGTWLSRVDNKVFAQRLTLWASGVDDTEPPAPRVINPIADVTVQQNSTPTQINLTDVFTDNGGTNNLTLMVINNTNPGIVTTTLSNTILTLNYVSGAIGTSEITIRATDQDNLYVEETFKIVISAPGSALYRINSGGTAYLASNNRQFQADAYNTGTRTYTVSSSTQIANTTDDALYQTERSESAFVYNIPVSSGSYNVVLHFAELYWGVKGTGGPGKRQFNVDIEGARKLTNYDIYAKTGAALFATQEIIPVSVSDGILNIAFSKGAFDLPKISAIEVLAASVNSPNQDPVADAGNDKNITLPINSITLNGTGTDPEGATLSYNWTQVSGPSTATVSGANTATLTLSQLLAGSYIFRLTVIDDAGLNAFDDVTVVVNPEIISNSAPIVANPIADQSTTVGTAFNYTFPATTFSDSDNDPLTYTASLANNVSLPNWLIFTASTRSFTGTPPSGSTASLTIKVTANDSKGGLVSDEFVLTITQPEGATTIRVNSGGTAYLASNNRQFQADAYNTGTRTYTVSSSTQIANTTDDALYQTERSESAFTYNIPVSSGSYNVVLHFAELYWGVKGTGGPGKRQFNVDIEGARKLTNYDIYAKTGAALFATQEIIPVSVSDGILNIAFSKGAFDLPKISAIEIIPVSISTNQAVVNTSNPEAAFNATSVLVYPNKFRNFINLKIQAKEPIEYDIEVYDMIGRLLYQSHFTPPSPKIGVHTIDLSGKNLLKGMYLVYVVNRTKNIFKIIKVLKE